LAGRVPELRSPSISVASETFTQTLRQPSLRNSYAKRAEGIHIFHGYKISPQTLTAAPHFACIHRQAICLQHEVLGSFWWLLKQYVKFEYREKQFGNLVPRVEKWSCCGFKHTDNLAVLFPLFYLAELLHLFWKYRAHAVCIKHIDSRFGCAIFSAAFKCKRACSL